MKHYVFMVDEYDPLPSANGNCVSALVDELVLRGNNVDVICYGDTFNYEYKKETLYNIHTIERDKLPDKKWGNIIYKIKCLPRVLWWPMGNPRLKEQYFKMLLIINERQSIDCIIACQLPLASSAAGIEFKSIVPTAILFIYELDAFWNSYYTVSGWKQMLVNKCKKIEKSFFDSADGIFHLECNRKVYDDELYKNYKNKSYYLDVPLISGNEYCKYSGMTQECENNSKKIKMIYAGSLSSTFRKPDYIVALVKKICEILPCELRFYSKGCEEYLQKEMVSNDCVKLLGYVAKDVLQKEIASSDYLISIGNSFPKGHNPIPSKIFEYMSTGKPIIHILAGEEDICKKYFMNYPKVLLLDPQEKFEKNIYSMKKFLLENKGTRVSFEMITKAFNKNTPQYSVNLISDVLINKKTKR